ncbi:DUF1800 domain-containing protein [Tautonia plasticadhaerens]|uniref:DUF1800 domain-containing protein n=1 Tax=Tautonia plasticadhaerens TaxID=2527974 RepID=A0A518GXV2_9BACT|nr:DUF1800 domain-containing protein [Tautonia plasticadhaerens]QDV33382.1 hypothetical protein ElP_12530 [Tautonia plasticadhaerens]
MRTPSPLHDPDRAWSRFEPTGPEPWDLARVAHLHRRAGFLASWEALRRDLDAGPEESVSRLLEGEAVALDGTPAPEFERLMDALARGPGTAGEGPGLQSAWLYRMIFSPHPLRERMTLFWHDHFATSIEKVGDARLMRRQNDLLRRLALGSFDELLRAIARDPAMLVWLDATANRKGRPNENYAREVMELFSIGRGHYTERDVREAARAFTGTFVLRGTYRHDPREFDGGEKSILGRTGPFDGEAVAGILLDRPECARFLARKLFRLFISEVEVPPDELIEPVAASYRESGYDSRVPVEMILRSRLFFDPLMRRRRVKSPVEFAVGTIRALEILSPTVPTDELARACGRMGQSLFAPPSVAGWDGGPAWINTTTTLARSNAVLALLGDARRFDPESLAARHGSSGDPAAFFVDLLAQDAFDRDVRARIRGSAREAALLVLTAPEYQLA